MKKLFFAIIILSLLATAFGQALVNQEELQKATDYYLKKIRSEPANLELHRELVDSYKGKGMISIPIDVYSKSVVKNADNPIVMYVLGYAYLADGSPDSLKMAEKNLKLALELKPTFPDALTALGDYYMKTGQENLAIENWQEARRTDEKFEPVYVSLGRFYRSKKQYEKALEEYDEAISLNSNQVGKRYLELGLMYMEIDDLKKAEETLIKAKSYEPKLGIIYYKLGQIYARNGDRDQAIRLYRDGRKHDPNNAQVAYELAYIFLERNDTKYALLSFERGLSADGVDPNVSKELIKRADKSVAQATDFLAQLANSSLSNNFNLLYFLGKLYLNQKKDDLAFKYFKLASSMPNVNADVHYQLGLLYEKLLPKVVKEQKIDLPQKQEPKPIETNQKEEQASQQQIAQPEALPVQTEEAQEQYRKAVELGAAEADLLFKVAQGYLDERQEDKYVEVAEKALTINDKRVDVHLKLVDIYLKKADSYNKANKKDEEENYVLQAIKHYEQVTSLQPDAKKWYNLGLLYERAGKSKAVKAVRAYESAIQLNPDYALAYYRRGNFMLNYKVGPAKVLMYKPEVAVDDLKKAIELNPNLADAHVSLGMAYYQMNMTEDATAEFEKAVLVDPNNLRAHIYLAQDYAQAEKYDKVIEHLSKAAELDNNNPQILKELSGMLLKYGTESDVLKAREVLEKAVKMIPDDPEVLMNYGYTLYLASRFNEAIANLKKALEIQPNYPEANYNIALAYSRIGQYKLAGQHWEKVIEQAPDSPLANKSAEYVKKIKESEKR
jgi:tetratricopeptide (TPR) repeat protein